MESLGANDIDGQADRPRERERASQSADKAKSCSVDKIDVVESVALLQAVVERKAGHTPFLLRPS
jgi:hypothetical protein